MFREIGERKVDRGEKQTVREVTNDEEEKEIKRKEEENGGE